MLKRMRKNKTILLFSKEKMFKGVKNSIFNPFSDCLRTSNKSWPDRLFAIDWWWDKWCNEKLSWRNIVSYFL